MSENEQQKLTVLTAACLDDMCGAWMAYATAKALYAAQDGEGPVCEGQFDILRTRLAGDYGSSQEAFAGMDQALRAEMASQGDVIALASAERLALVVAGAEALYLEGPMLPMMLRHIAGTEALSRVDEHGVEWILRYFRTLGFGGERKAVPEGQVERAGAEEIYLLRRLWSEFSVSPDVELDGEISRWLASSFNVSALRFLDRATAWRAIETLRELILRGDSGAAIQ